MSGKDSFNQKLVYFGDTFMPFDQASLSIASAAVLYGLSVYTVFSVNKTPDGMAAFRLADHYQRLVESAQIMGIDTFATQWSKQKFIAVAEDLIRKNVVTEDVFVRASVHVDALVPGTRSRGLHTTLSMFIYPAVSIVPANGARLKSSVWRRVPDNAIPARAKVNGAYVNSVLAKQDALDSGYDDAIFLDASGHVCELSAANIFLIKNGVLITPDTTSDLLEGINRKTVIELARIEGMQVVERTVDLTELYVADEVFACGTSAFVTPVIKVDARTIGNGKPGSHTAKISQWHNDVLHGTHKLSGSLLHNIV